MHGDDHVHGVLVKVIFTQCLSAKRDKGEEGVMVLLVSTSHRAFLLSHTPGPLSSMLVYKFLCMWKRCWVRRAVHSRTQPRSLHVFPEQGRSCCAPAYNTQTTVHICQQLTPGKPGQAFVDRGTCQSIILPSYSHLLLQNVNCYY